MTTIRMFVYHQTLNAHPGQVVKVADDDFARRLVQAGAAEMVQADAAGPASASEVAHGEKTGS
jgi:ABC-type taurine transport system ATPase subunit